MQGADDCAQEIILRMLEGRHQHATLKFAVIDYLRRNLGNPKHSTYETRKSLTRPAYLDEIDFEDRVGLPSGNRLDIERLLLAFDPIDRAIFYLHFGWGLTLSECGYVLGFSESRASIRLRRALDYLKDKFKS